MCYPNKLLMVNSKALFTIYKLFNGATFNDTFNKSEFSGLLPYFYTVSSNLRYVFI